jgi:hypothetical protein
MTDTHARRLLSYVSICIIRCIFEHHTLEVTKVCRADFHVTHSIRREDALRRGKRFYCAHASRIMGSGKEEARGGGQAGGGEVPSETRCATTGRES